MGPVPLNLSITQYLKACKFYIQSVKQYLCGININFLNMTLHTNTCYSRKSTKLIQNIRFPPLNCSTIKLWARSQNSKIWDQSHVMRDRSHLDGIGTPRTHSYHEIYYAIHYEYASHVQKSGVELWSICMIILKLRET